MGNPLVAAASDSTSPFSALALIEDGQALAHAIESGDWVEGGFAAFSLVMDSVAALVDPLGTLIANGLGWVIDHLEPLKGWFNSFTGDASQVAAFAQTWGNVGSRMHESADALVYRLGDFEAMTGETVAAYGRFAHDAAAQFRATGDWANAIGQGMEMASTLVQVVHDVVRDAISQVVGTAISVAIELALTVGLATPAAIAQISARVSAMTTRVSGTVTKLLAAFKKLGGLLKSLKALFAKGAAAIKKMLTGRRSSGAVSNASEKVRYTGASIDRAPKDILGQMEWADLQYERIRRSSSDIDEIVQHIDGLVLPGGERLTAADVGLVKEHVFLREHPRRDIETGELFTARFDADFRQAEIWGRLQKGHASDLDLLWLRHELTELRYMNRNPGVTYNEAHDYANAIADWHSAWLGQNRGK